MPLLPASLAAWNTPAFADTFKQELARLDTTLSLLQQGLRFSSYALAEKLKISVISANELPGTIQVKAGLFYTGVIAGCSCADDPTPVDEIAEYCEVLVDIDKVTAGTKITLIAE
ncbi:MAG: hypothetical protein Q8O37_13445 [Sulfuricellaceae bacterium]|nr:hypothetical protein [Sulfuricellaceae bacterium]